MPLICGNDEDGAADLRRTCSCPSASARSGFWSLASDASPGPPSIEPRPTPSTTSEPTYQGLGASTNLGSGQSCWRAKAELRQSLPGEGNAVVKLHSPEVGDELLELSSSTCAAGMFGRASGRFWASCWSSPRRLRSPDVGDELSEMPALPLTQPGGSGDVELGSTRLNKELGTSHGVSSVIDNENNVTRDATKRAATALILSTYSHLAKDEWAVGCWRRWAAPDRHREELRAGGAVRQRSKSPAPRQRGIEKVGRRFRSPCCCNRGRMKMLNRKMLKRKMLNLAMKFGKVLVFVLVFTPDMLTQAKLEEDELTLDLSAESLETFFAALRLKLIKYCLTDTRAGHHILKNNIYAERFKPPSMWIKVNLWDGEDFKGALYFRSDSLYLLAFANKGGTVFYMKGHEKTFELLNDAVALPFGEAYDELTDKLGEELVSDLLQLVTLGQEPARMAANDLAEYDGVDKPDQIAVKRALLTFTILIAESMRTKDIRARCIQYWKGCTRLTSLEAQQTLLWNKLCEIFFSKPEYVATDPVTKYRNVMGTIAVTHMSDIDNIVDFLIDRRKPGPAPPPPATVRKAGRAPRPPPSATVQQEVAYRQQYFWKRILTHPPPEPTPASAPPHVRVPPHVLSPPTPWPAMSDVGASAAAMPPHADQKNY